MKTKSTLPDLHRCHFCKIEFDPASPYHRGISYKQPEESYSVCSDCVITGTKSFEQSPKSVGHSPTKKDIMLQLSEMTGISAILVTHSYEKGEV